MKSQSDKDLLLYLKEIQKYPLLPHEKITELTRRAHKGDIRARNQIIRANLRLVVPIARQYLNRGLTFPDLIEEGNIGLLKAVEHYNPSKGRFSTYATFWVRQTVIRAILTSAKTIRLPCHVIEIIAKWKHATAELSQKLGRPLHPYEVCEEINLTPENIRLLRKTLRRGISSARRLTNLDILTDKGYLVTRRTKNAPGDFRDSDDSEWISHLFNKISPMEALILKLRYGLEEYQSTKTLREIGAELGYSFERIRQIEQKALKRLYYAIIQRNERER